MGELNEISKVHASWGELWLHKLELFRDRIIFIDADSGRKWTGGQIKETITDYAAGLIKGLNLKPGDVCCISFDNNDLTVVLALAIVLAGGVVSCMYPIDPYPELLYLARKTDIKYLFCHSINQWWGRNLSKDLNKRVQTIVLDSDAKLAVDGDITDIHSVLECGRRADRSTLHIPADVGDTKDAIAFMSLSSGTTGKPKVIPITHENGLLESIFGTRTRSDVFSCPGSLDYTSARLIVFGAIYSGCSVVIMNGFQADKFLHYVEKYRITTIYMGSGSFHSLITHPDLHRYDISSLTTIFPMGARLKSNRELADFLAKHSHIKYCFQGYGSSELGG